MIFHAPLADAEQGAFCIQVAEMEQVVINRFDHDKGQETQANHHEIAVDVFQQGGFVEKEQDIDGAGGLAGQEKHQRESQSGSDAPPQQQDDDERQGHVQRLDQINRAHQRSLVGESYFAQGDTGNDRR